jgi:hypothetical protein
MMQSFWSRQTIQPCLIGDITDRPCEGGFSLIVECIQTACWFWKEHLPAPFLENFRGYESMSLTDHLADGIYNPLFRVIYCFARRDQEGFEVSPIRNNTNEQ